MRAGTLLFLLALSNVALASPTAVVGGRVLTMTGKTFDPGTVVFDGDKIVAVGPTSTTEPPANANRLDARGMTVMPGFFDAGTSIGLVEIGAVAMTDDRNERSAPVVPQMHVTDAFHAESALIPVARANGIAHVLVPPGEDGLIAGQSAVVRLGGETAPEYLVAGHRALHVNLGEPPINHWRGKKKSPSTRMGAAALLRQTFIAAQEYKAAKARYERKRREFEAEKGSKKTGKDTPKEPEPPDPDLRLESLLPALAGLQPVVFRAQRSDDILTALRLAKEFSLRPIISHGAEAWMVTKELVAAKAPVVLGGVRQVPSQMETLGATYENAARLHRAGVPIAFRTGWTHDLRNLPYHVAVAVSYGLPKEKALEGLTIVPATIFGLGDRLGTLESGKEATLQILDGDPLEITTSVQHLFIAGRKVNLGSRHTQLYERYR